MLRLQPVSQPDALQQMLRASEFGDESRLLRQSDFSIHSKKLVGVRWIAIIHKRAANLQELVELHLSHATASPETLAALVDFIGHADGNRVQVRVQRRNRGLEQQLPGKRFELVVAETGERPYIQDYRGLVAAADEDFYFLAVLNPVRVGERERSRGSIG